MGIEIDSLEQSIRKFETDKRSDVVLRYRNIASNAII